MLEHNPQYSNWNVSCARYVLGQCIQQNIQFHYIRKHNRYSDVLRAGRSGNRIPVQARYSAPVQTGPGAHPASWVAVYSLVKTAGAWS